MVENGGKRIKMKTITENITGVMFVVVVICFCFSCHFSFIPEMRKPSPYFRSFLKSARNTAFQFFYPSKSPGWRLGFYFLYHLYMNYLSVMSLKIITVPDVIC